MLHPITLSLALLQAPAPAPVVPQPAAAPPAQPAPAAAPPAAQPTAPAPAQPAAAPPGQPAQPAPPAQPYAQPAQPGQPYPNQPYSNQPYPNQPYPNQPYPPAQPYPNQPYAQPGYPPNPYYPYPPPPNAAPPPPANVAEGPGALPESVTHRKLVFANLYTLNFSIFSPIPSGDFTFFLGTNLRPRKNRARTFDWNTALGYQLTLSVGLADMPTFDLSNLNVGFPIFVHRHHFTAMGYGGKNQRLFYSVGGGALFVLSTIGGVEGEGRLGYVFTDPAKRVKGIVGGQARLTAAFEGIPLLQIGPFIGFMAF